MIRSGVYAITNLTTNRVYIGSSLDIETRFKAHRYMLDSGTHSSVDLLADWTSLGEQNFRFEVIEEADENTLGAREMFWIRSYRDRPTGMYNKVFTASRVPRARTMTEKLLTVAQVAKLLGVHVNTVRNWADKGLIKVVMLPSGYRRFEPAEIERLRKEMGLGDGQ